MAKITIEKLCGHYKDVVAQEYEKDKPLIEQFCQKYSAELISVDVTSESSTKEPVFEPLYIFNDNLGGYTRKGLENSLKEE